MDRNEKVIEMFINPINGKIWELKEEETPNRYVKKWFKIYRDNKLVNSGHVYESSLWSFKFQSGQKC